jgi:hypothetical protein
MRKAARAVDTGRLFDWRERNSFRFVFFTTFTGSPPIAPLLFFLRKFVSHFRREFRGVDFVSVRPFRKIRVLRERLAEIVPTTRELSDQHPVRWQFKANHTE